MSTQRGNVKKGAQKHKNQKAFKNDLYDTSHITKKINSIEFHGICEHCKSVLEWKVKYKKYKLLSVAKKCVKCLEKKVKDSYYIVCNDCCEKHKICCKCSKPCEEVALGESEADRMRREAEFQFELQNLKERQRRKFLRLLDKGVLTKENLAEEGAKALGIDLDDEDNDSDYDDLEEKMSYIRLKENHENNEDAQKVPVNEDDDDYEDISDDEDEYDEEDE